MESELKSGFYWVRIGEHWTVGQWADGRWYVVGDEVHWNSPGSEGRASDKLDEIGPLIPPRKIPAAQKAGAK